MLKILVIILYILCSSFGMILIRKGGLDSTFKISTTKIDLNFSWLFFLGMALYFVSFVFWLYILQLFPLTFISPVAYGVVYIVIAVLSALILKENISPKMIVASILIVTGVFIASIKV